MGQFITDHLDVIIVYAVLFSIGLIYNHYVDWMEEENMLGGRKAFLVCIGVAYTLSAVAFVVPLDYLFIVAGAFFFALIPMVWGDIRRHSKVVNGLRRFWQGVEERKRNGHS